MVSERPFRARDGVAFDRLSGPSLAALWARMPNAHCGPAAVNLRVARRDGSLADSPWQAYGLVHRRRGVVTGEGTKAQDRGSEVILSVFVRPAPGPGDGPEPKLDPGEECLTYLCDRLEGSGGREESRSSAGAAYRFDSWTQASSVAIELTSRVEGATAPLAGIHLGVGLDMVPAVRDASGARAAATLAESADPNEIWLGPALAAVARHDPPDYYAVRPVESSPEGLVAVHRLLLARDAVPTNLVPPRTSFVGREAEIARIRHLLQESRLVTVTGPPGAGKTRIATEISQRMLGGVADGVWFVPLAAVTDPALVLSAVADALNLRPGADGSLIDLLSAHLNGTHVLIVLDNFEHVDAAAGDVGALLEAIPTLRLLVTSRTSLRLSGEHEYVLQPLDLPRPGMSSEELAGTEAVMLFTRRAVTAAPSFRVDAESLAQVAELCQRLDGLPLALELAAARTKLLPPAAVLARLDHRLTLLRGGPRDLPARHQSLRAAVAWSYDLLKPEGQALFRRLSVFRGGWTIEAALAVCPELRNQEEVLETLGVLLDASLVTSQPASVEAPRFTMLETLREYAAERLDNAGESELARSRHAAHLLELVEGMEGEFTGRDSRAALDRIGEEHDNIRAALRFLVTRAPEESLRLASGLWRFWQMRGHLLEASQWLAEALAAAGDDAPAAIRAKGLTAAGGIAYWRGRMDEVQPFYEGALGLRRAVGDEVAVADALYDLAFVFQPEYAPPPADPSRTARALTLVGEAEELYERVGHKAGLAKSLWLRGNLQLNSDSHEAKRLLGESVEQFRTLGDPFGLGWALYALGLALLGTAELDAAGAAFGEAINLFAAAGDGSAMGLLLEAFGEVAAAEGDAPRAARLRGAAARNRLVTEAEIAFANPPWLVGTPEQSGTLDPSVLEVAWNEGREMTATAAVAFALGADAGPSQDDSLRVTALGSFRAERGGRAIAQWGGPKAGSRQAQAMFAFLLDRADRGVTKDEFLEVIWPDAELEQGDLNFHRTLGGLRTTLAGDGLAGRHDGVVFANGRYRLGAAVVGWLDAAEFERGLANAGQATDDLSAIRGLEGARSLYRGDFLDDCPLYGDSGFVEERRGLLRGRLVDALVDLGRRYERRGDLSLAAARLREALAVSGGHCPSASAGLERLGVAEAVLPRDRGSG